MRTICVECMRPDRRYLIEYVPHYVRNTYCESCGKFKDRLYIIDKFPFKSVHIDPKEINNTIK